MNILASAIQALTAVATVDTVRRREPITKDGLTVSSTKISGLVAAEAAESSAKPQEIEPYVLSLYDLHEPASPRKEP